MLDLLSTMNRVETPFIIAEIGGIKFGAYEVNGKNIIGSAGLSQYGVIYPNFMKSLSITKINGTVNTYNLQLVYAIQAGDDPNFLEKVFSKLGNTWNIYLSYGDLSLPTYIYKREKALVTSVRSNVDFASSKITYNLSCTSSSVLAASANHNFPKVTAKPSDIIKNMLYNNAFGLLEVFYGMKDKNKVLLKNLIASDDASVVIEAKTDITPLQYLEYLVKCMVPNNQQSNDIIHSSVYRICVIDDTSDDFEGPYFKVARLSDNIQKDSLDVYSIDVGYPDKNSVISFDINNNQTYSILYKYSKDVKQPEYIQRIDNEGNLVSQYSPAISNTRDLLKTTSEDKAWWSSMVNFPITATLKIKGLIKPAILMSYVYIDARFYGREHYSSGYYMITKQIDEVSSAGYRTTLSLTRVPKGTLQNGN